MSCVIVLKTLFANLNSVCICVKSVDLESTFTEKLGIAFDDALLRPSWNGQTMEEVYPWGTIRVPTTEVNVATMNELSGDQKSEIRSICSMVLTMLDYQDFVQDPSATGVGTVTV